MALRSSSDTRIWCGMGSFCASFTHPRSSLVTSDAITSLMLALLISLLLESSPADCIPGFYPKNSTPSLIQPIQVMSCVYIPNLFLGRGD